MLLAYKAMKQKEENYQRDDQTLNFQFWKAFYFFLQRT